jgi:cell division protein DivIC
VKSRRFILLIYFVLFAGLGTGAGVLFSDAKGQYDKLKRDEANNRRRLAEAEARLAEQEQILKRLQTDPVFLEKVLRRNGYAQPGEYIFRFED